jgi:hypothetical protein
MNMTIIIIIIILSESLSLLDIKIGYMFLNTVNLDYKIFYKKLTNLRMLLP